MKKILVFIFTISLHFAFSQHAKTYLFVGTYTEAKPDKGIYIYEFNSKDGALTLVNNGKDITNPSYLTITQNGKYIYACTDTRMPNAGSISAFSFDKKTASIKFLNKVSSGGENPAFVTTTKNGKYILNANFTEGTASVFMTNKDGSINPYTQNLKFEGKGKHETRQNKAHIHATVFDPFDRYVFLPDLGSDKIRVFKFEQKSLTPLQPLEQYDFNAIPGSGPRHFIFHPNNKHAYCIEISGTVNAFKYRDGKLDTIQRIFSNTTIKNEYSSADIHASPDGRFLYASNRGDGENNISIFTINPANGKLTLVGHQSTFGTTPRNFTIDPTGQYLLVANQSSNNIIVFKRNMSNGLLTKLEKEISIPQPTCLKMVVY
jgi:6-phosphogluconolactonase